MSFYDTFETLCNKKGVTPTGAARDNGISQSVVGMWKKRGSVPKYETLKKLANYFNVTVDQLVAEREHADSIIDHMKEKIADLNELAYGNLKSADEVEKDIENTKAAAQAAFALSQLDVNEQIADEFIDVFLLLNDEGQQKVVEYADDLIKIPQYQRKPQEGDENAVDKEKDD